MTAALQSFESTILQVQSMTMYGDIARTAVATLEARINVLQELNTGAQKINDSHRQTNGDLRTQLIQKDAAWDCVFARNKSLSELNDQLCKNLKAANDRANQLASDRASLVSSVGILRFDLKEAEDRRVREKGIADAAMKEKCQQNIKLMNDTTRLSREVSDLRATNNAILGQLLDEYRRGPSIPFPRYGVDGSGYSMNTDTYMVRVRPEVPTYQFALTGYTLHNTSPDKLSFLLDEETMKFARCVRDQIAAEFTRLRRTTMAPKTW